MKSRCGVMIETDSIRSMSLLLEMTFCYPRVYDCQRSFPQGVSCETAVKSRRGWDIQETFGRGEFTENLHKSHAASRVKENERHKTIGSIYVKKRGFENVTVFEADSISLLWAMKLYVILMTQAVESATTPSNSLHPN